MKALSIVKNYYDIELQGNEIRLLAKESVTNVSPNLTRSLLEIKRHKANTLHVLHQETGATTFVVGVDLETTSLLLNEGRIRVASVYGENSRVVTENLEEIKLLLADSQILKVFHNAAFDVVWLRHEGYEVNNYSDTFIMSQLIRNHTKQGNSLEELANTKLGIELNKNYQHSTNWQHELTQEHINYVLLDAKATYELYFILMEQIQEKHLDIVLAREMAAMDAIIELKMHGIPFNYNEWEKELEVIELESEALQTSIREMLQVPQLNLNSPKQIRLALSSHDIIVDGTSDEVLAKYEHLHPSISMIRRYKKLKKQLSSFGEKLRNEIAGDGRLRGNWKICGTDTFRMSCKNPNLQGMPTISKPYFQATEGYSFIVADYSAIELRILGEITQDPELLDAFQKGEDLHNKTAAFVFGKSTNETITSTERKVGKIVNFGLVYGMTKWGLQKKINAAIEDPITLHEAEMFRTKYFELYKGVLAYQDRMLKADFIETLGGRYWCDGHEMLKKGSIARFNYPIQGSCAEGLKESLAIFMNERLPTWKFVAIVHDEIVIEVPDMDLQKATKCLETSMIQGMQRLVKQAPIEVEIKQAKYWIK